MTLRHIKIFTAVFRCSSVTKAAAELHLAQPSVSLAVKELEEYYGVRLFERIGRSISPTEAGKEFYGYALHIVSLFDEMEKKIRNWDTVGSLRIGASITIGTRILPVLLKEFRKEYPELRTEAFVGRSQAIEQRILDNAADIGLIENQPGNPDLCAIPFMQDELCAVVPPDHPLAGRKKAAALEELAQYPFLMREKGSGTRALFDEYLERNHIPIHCLIEAPFPEAMKHAVIANHCLAVISVRLIEDEIRKGTIHMLQDPENIWNRTFKLVYHKDKFISESILTLKKLLEQYPKPELPLPADTGI